MKKIFSYIRNYIHQANKQLFFITTIFIGIFIFINYHFRLNDFIQKNHSFSIKLIAWYAIFIIAFGVAYFLTTFFHSTRYFKQRGFLFLFLLAPLLFSLKHTINFSFIFSSSTNSNLYWNSVVYWPLLATMMTFLLILIAKYTGYEQPLFGWKFKNMDWRPYWLMLLIMLPLIALAATQADFLAMYPKLKIITGLGNINNFSRWHQLLFELSYGSDFFTIELFFRGFLVLAFVKYAGKEAILPMACFYCTIHFGKPMAECISSYFGGLLLGIIVYNTRSIAGGLMVHLGIAWMMEIAGYIGNSL